MGVKACIYSTRLIMRQSPDLKRIRMQFKPIGGVP